MERRTFWKTMQALVLIFALPWGVNTASAGPGGGTFYANSPAGGLSGTALRKFVDSLPGVGPANANNLGQYIPLAAPDTTTFPGSDYYIIGLKDYTQKLHSDLPKATKLRGYYQINGTDHSTQYMGPLIVASQNRPVRVRFENHLGVGTAGNLFLPVDTTAMGAGMAPYTSTGAACDPTLAGANCAKYTQNRATLHLHGGNTPWISDGTPHQWTAPVGENTVPVAMRKGPSAKDVPDMPASGDGALTFFFSNQQSNRLMFYHDHAYGLTRLNVYAGEAAGYLLTDPTETGLINSGVLPNLGGVYTHGIPLIIQDKTFVPSNIDVQDAAWNFMLDTSQPGPTNRPTTTARNKTTYPWGAAGDLWFPHVYEANQAPNDPSGANPFGRWDYGPWFWPPVIVDPTKANLPDPSLSPEAFMDTPIVNGTAYPYMTVQPKAYRFRILNACNDRSLNLQLYYADPNDPTGKDVKMVPAGPNPAFPPTWPTDGRDGGVPDPALVGPSMIQIGNEGGFLPQAVVLNNTPIGYDYNRRNIVVLNVLYKTLLLGAAERADVIIDFSSVPPGSNIILYNDAPAPLPAFDPRYDYYTGDLDQTPSGGAPSTIRGYGPNTRTIMQFRVAGTPSAPFNLAALQAALPAAFKASQPPPIVPESTWPVASGGNAPTDLYSKIQDYFFNYQPVGSTIPTMIEFKSKAIQELWDPYGRMNATLGVELPFTTNLNQTTVPMGFAEPATEFITDGQPQIWKITHNGVDTHPVHFHLFNVQLINRVGWDGAIRPPDDNEVGWKETVRMNPLEDAIVAFKPVKQSLPFALPRSSRPIDPTLPLNAPVTTTDVTVTPPVATTVPNAMTDYGFEYVWHCHILGHEENDFMRPIVFNVPTTVPSAPTGLNAYVGGTLISAGPPAVYNSGVNSVYLTWTDTGTTPSSFRVERATVTGTGTGTVGPYAPLATLSFISAAAPAYTDNSVAQNTRYKYRIIAFNVVGDSTALVSATVTTRTWGKATGLTITASVPSPHIQGTLVNFTGIGTGATDTVANTTVTYQYRFWLTSGTVKTLVQDYGYGASWALPANTPVGTYTITVDVRTSPTGNTNPTGGYDVSKTMTYSIVVPTSPPVTVATPVPGVYSSSAPTGAPVSPLTVNVTLTATTPYPPATIYYTTDGVTVPTTATLTKFTNSGTIPVTATTTIQYFAVDANGVAEAVHTDSWTIHAPDLTVGSSVVINNGAASTNNTAVTLTINAADPLGLATMQFANDNTVNTVWSAEEPFAPTKAWALAAGTDGTRTVYVRVRDKSLPTGTQYTLSGTINLDTVPPVSSATPIAGTYGFAPVPVALSANEPSTIYYTIDGTDPKTSATRQTYVAPIGLSATTTIKYYAVDVAGNAELLVNSGTWTINASNSLVSSSIAINNGAAATNSPTVNLTLAAVAPAGLQIAQMQFSNDGLTYSAPVAYATSYTGWPLSTGDGTKTVYVRFIDNALGGGYTYPPITATIVLDTVAPITTTNPIPGGYTTVPLPVTLTASEPATTYYTTDGTTPTTASTKYTGPISLAATTTIQYFSVDAAGNVEAVKSGTWGVNPLDLTGSVIINNGALQTNNQIVNLTLSATDPTGVATMQFSDDGISYSPEEPYATTKTWPLSPGDGVKTVYVRYRDNDVGGGTLYAPVTAQITLDTVPPATTISPIPGTYAATPINITLSSEAGANIYYTVDGTVPTTTSPLYTGPFSISADTTVQYFAVDPAGNKEAVKSAAYAISVLDMTATVGINNGAAFTNTTNVTLNLNAVDPLGVATMQFSSDGINYTAEEPYAATKAWTLTHGDGVKTVYAKFRDAALGGGVLYGPFTASITLDTVAPATTISPAPGIYAAAPVNVTLTSEPNARIYYTVNGTVPTTASTLYTAPFSVSGLSTTVQYFAVDQAGNQEAVKSAVYAIPVQTDMVASVTINSGATVTNNTAVTLTLNASDATGVVAMQFSDDGVSYTVEEPYATSKAWTLTSGNGLKTVYVRFRDGAGGGGTLYGPFTASITLDTVPPVTTAGPIPGTYSAVPILVTLSANKPATIYYTTDWRSQPNTNSSIYTGPISVSATTTIQYFAVDTAGNVEAVKSGTWTVHSQDMVSSVTIDNGSPTTNTTAVTLSLSASDPTGVTTMQFSNDGVSYTAEEPYATTKTWALTPGDGTKTVYVRFRDGSLPTGNLYDPVTATIILDTVPPVTTASPVPGTYVMSTPIAITLAANGPATTYYTTDGSVPTTSSTKYTVPIVVGTTTTIKYFSVDSAGNVEAVKSGTWTSHTTDMTSSVVINNGASSTGTTAVTLTLTATDPDGVATMQFSNDGVVYSPEEPFATTKAWTLAPGDGTKTVYARFRDNSGGGGNLYDPVTATITLDTITPVTTASPVPGTYSTIPVSVTLTASKPGTIYYTTNGSVPTTSSTKYTGPISVAATTTISYFSVDTAGNVEAAKNGTWTIHLADMVASVKINGGAASTNTASVTLTLNAVDPLGVSTMQFSNDGINYTTEEPYATTKAWTLASGNGLKTVYVRFRDNSLPSGNLYDPVTASISLDTAPPVTTAGPIPGTYATTPLLVTLAANKTATIYYTTDGSTPTTSSTVYTGPISLAATSTIKYFAVDAAGNTETVNTGTWTIKVADMAASVTINGRAAFTTSQNVSLTLSATDPDGVAFMQFSNDGITYSAEEPYNTTKAWALTSGDGTKTVYVRFRDGAGTLYDPVTASITLTTVTSPDGRLLGNPTLGIGDALRALQIAVGMVTPTASDMAHGDVAPLVNGRPSPDGVIDTRDALVILRAVAGLVTL